MENFKELLAAYVQEINEKHAIENGDFYEFKAGEFGKRFVKVLLKTKGSTVWGSVHCFVEIATGHIYKPAGWATPAKGIRGRLTDEKKPIFCGDYYAGR